MRKIFKKYYKIYLLTLIIVLIFNIPSKLIFDTVYFQGAGIPENINHVINVDGHKSPDNYYLTYVSTTRSKNVLSHLLLLMNNNFDKYYIPENSTRSQMSDKEYNNLMINMKDESLSNAYYYANTYLNKSVHINKQGILVEYTDSNELKTNDLIVKIDNQIVKNKAELSRYLLNKINDDKVKLEVFRNNEYIEIEHNLKILSNGKKGLGIIAKDYIDINDIQDLLIHDEGLQGPSAGLMFTLYLIDLLSDNDLSKGYKIAGTGTISPYGEVGQIGGIDYKIQGAIKDNVDIFFVPKDMNDYDTNEKDAIKLVGKFQTNMKVIAVSNISEALDYLKKI